MRNLEGWRIVRDDAVRLRHRPRHQNRKFWKLKMADGLLFENSSIFISQPTIVVFSMKFGMQIHGVSRRVRWGNFAIQNAGRPLYWKSIFGCISGIVHVTVTHAPCHVSLPRAGVKNHFAPGCSLLPLATLHATTTTARSCCYLSNHCQRIDRFCRTARMICECSPVQAVIVWESTATWRSHSMHTLKMTPWVSKVKSSKGRKQEKTQSWLTKAPHFLFNIKLGGNIQSSLGSTTHVIIIIIIIIIITTVFIVLSSWPGHCGSSLGSSGECRTAPSGRRPSDQATWLGLWVRLF